jgi:hypothetical protein
MLITGKIAIHRCRDPKVVSAGSQKWSSLVNELHFLINPRAAFAMNFTILQLYTISYSIYMLFECLYKKPTACTFNFQLYIILEWLIRLKYSPLIRATHVWSHHRFIITFGIITVHHRPLSVWVFGHQKLGFNFKILKQCLHHLQAVYLLSSDIWYVCVSTRFIYENTDWNEVPCLSWQYPYPDLWRLHLQMRVLTEDQCISAITWLEKSRNLWNTVDESYK